MACLNFSFSCIILDFIEKRKGILMKFIVTLFWSLAIGQVIGFLGAKLLAVQDSAVYATIVSVAFAVFIYLLGYVGVLPEKKEAE
jgi:NhaP-type Na+/H+ or K+/H+ antiporter